MPKVKATNPTPRHRQHDRTTLAAWNDPVKGSEITKAQINQGADVVYAAAGGTGVGVLKPPPTKASCRSAWTATRTTCTRKVRLPC